MLRFPIIKFTFQLCYFGTCKTQSLPYWGVKKSYWVKSLAISLREN